MGDLTFYLPVAVTLALIILSFFYFLFKVRCWHFIDLFLVLAPGFLHAILIEFDFYTYKGMGKTGSNSVVESVCLGLGVNLLFLLRVLIVWKDPKKMLRASLSLIIISLLFTFGIYIFTPAIPE